MIDHCVACGIMTSSQVRTSRSRLVDGRHVSRRRRLSSFLFHRLEFIVVVVVVDILAAAAAAAVVVVVVQTAAARTRRALRRVFLSPVCAHVISSGRTANW